jgi:hypothetical protein
MSRDHHPPLRDVTADTENTIVACWTVFTELLLGNALTKSVTILSILAQMWISLPVTRNVGYNYFFTFFIIGAGIAQSI